MKVVAYKAVFRPPGDDDYDKLHPPECGQVPGVDFVIFRDVKQEGFDSGWRVLPKHFEDVDNRRRARHHKCLPFELFPEAEWAIWMDGSLTPKVSPLAIVAACSGPDFWAFDRIKRSCAYAEADAMARKGRDSPVIIAAQCARYRREGYPPGNGLCATTALVWRNTPAAAALGRQWWSEIERGSNRDQISINFCLWRLRMNWGRLPGQWNNSPLFTWRRHYDNQG